MHGWPHWELRKCKMQGSLTFIKYWCILLAKTLFKITFEMTGFIYRLILWKEKDVTALVIFWKPPVNEGNWTCIFFFFRESLFFVQNEQKVASLHGPTMLIQSLKSAQVSIVNSATFAWADITAFLDIVNGPASTIMLSTIIIWY